MLLLAIAFFVLIVQKVQARDIYVDVGNNDYADGYSWTTALALQRLLALALNCEK